MIDAMVGLASVETSITNGNFVVATQLGFPARLTGGKLSIAPTSCHQPSDEECINLRTKHKQARYSAVICIWIQDEERRIEASTDKHSFVLSVPVGYPVSSTLFC